MPKRTKRKRFKTLRFIAAFFTLIITSSLIYLALTFANGFFGLGFGTPKPYQNFVVGGVDADGYRTDSLMVCQYDFYGNTLSIMQIPRDTWVSASVDHKINSAYAMLGKKGEETMLAMVKEVTGLEVSKFAIVELQGFRQIIDEIGGVEFEVPFRMKYDDPYQNLHIDLYPGVQTLNGKKAEQFVRWRHNNEGMVSPGGGGDLVRVGAQADFMKAVADKLLSFGNIPKAPKLLTIAKSNTVTNFTDDELLNLIISALKMPKDNIRTEQLPGESSYTNGLSYFIHDKDQTREIINEYFTPMKDKLPEDAEINLQKNKYLTVEVINAGDLSPELIEALADYIRGFGFNITSIIYEAEPQDYSELIDHNIKGAADEIAKVYPVSNITNDHNINKDATCDVTLIIGKENLK